MGQNNVGHRFTAKQGKLPEVLVKAIQRFPSQLREERNRRLFDGGVFGVGIDVAHRSGSGSVSSGNSVSRMRRTWRRNSSKWLLAMPHSSSMSRSKYA